MRLPEVDRGDTLSSRALIGFISLVTGMRLPDAARVAFYHRDYLSRPLGQWTQATMRGPGAWRIGERELMGAMVASWNSCAFCIGAHRAVAIKDLPQQTVDAALADYRAAPISPGLKATLAFLEKMTRHPDELAAADARAVLAAGVTEQALVEAIAVGAIFNIVTRYADALGFAMPTPAEFDKAADMLLKRGYGS